MVGKYAVISKEDNHDNRLPTRKKQYFLCCPLYKVDGKRKTKWIPPDWP
jgi:hypothetical protein